MSKFPRFRIRYSMGIFTETNSKHHHLELERIVCHENPSDKRIFYATRTTRGWRKLPIGEGTIGADKGETIVGSWFPYKILKDDEAEQKRFDPDNPESPIIWRVEYKGIWYWHTSCEMFERKGEKWIPAKWDIYYANGLKAKFLGLRHYCFDRARRQINRWTRPFYLRWLPAQSS